MRITPIEIQQHQFKTRLFGYDTAAVDHFLEMLADELERLHKQNNELKESLARTRTALEQMREREATWIPIERAASYGDMVVMDITGTVGDETIMDQQSWEHVLSEEGNGSLPGFDSALVDVKANEGREFELTYPEDAQRWAGKTARFQVQVHGVKAKELPELDDAFAKMLGEYQSLDELMQ